MKKYNPDLIELLAPARDLECGTAAINCGADALYIGGPKFGARTNASNSLQVIEKLIHYAHFYKAKVYVTLNTLLYDSELEEAQKLINQLYEMNADAIIIQDMGILEMKLPPIPLFASTQTHNCTAEKVQFLEKTGFQRVILARELSLDQIKEIRLKTQIPLESFIHGALCVSFSGQCYLSCAIGKRSGNRGECAQPCRNIYSLYTESGKIIIENKHLLSLKDLSFSQSIEDLIEAGITSFKIEGRLKDLNYIKNTVTFYRKSIDQILEKKNLKKSSRGKVFTTFIPDLSKTYNRNYCDYFVNGRKKGMTSWDTPKWKGEEIGCVKEVRNDGILIEKCLSNLALKSGDGVCFFDSQGILTGTLVNQAFENQIVLENTIGLKVNAILYRNHDQEFLKKLKTVQIQRKIQTDFEFGETLLGFYLKATDEEGQSFKVEKELKKEMAQNAEQSIKNIEKQLGKTGETPFYLNELKIEFSSEKTYFIPISFLNEMRREVLEGLTQVRNNNYFPMRAQLQVNDIPYPQKKLDYTANVLNSLAKKFYERHGVTEIEMGAEYGTELKNKKVMTCKYCILFELGLCLKINPSDEKYFLKDLKGQKYPLVFDCENCRMEVYFG